MAALETFSETTEQTANNAANLGDMLEGKGTVGAKVINNLLSGLRNVGDILTFGFADDLGSWLSDTLLPEIKVPDPTKEMLQGAKANRWARETARRTDLTPAMKSMQEKLDQGFVKAAEAGNTELQKTQEAGLNSIAVLLERLNVTTDEQKMLAMKHLTTAAKMAGDGEITAKETERFSKILKNQKLYDLNNRVSS